MNTVLHVVPQVPFTTTTFIAQTITVAAEAGWHPSIQAGRRRWRQNETTRVANGSCSVIRPSLSSYAASALTTHRSALSALTAAQGTELARRAAQHGGRIVVHAHFAARPLEIALAAKQRIGVPVVVTAHAADLFATSDQRGLVEALEHADAVVTISERGFRHVRGLTNNVRLELIPCSLPLHEFPERSAPAHRRVVTVGRLVEKKGIDVVIRLAERMMASQPDLEWALVGDGPLRPQVESFARRAERFQFIPSLTHQRVLELVAKSSVFVLPSRRSQDGDEEGVPIALIEAMALGVPVVAGRSGGVPEVVTPGATGYLLDADADDAATWMGAIAAAMTEEGAALAARARARIAAERDPFLEGRSYAKLYDELAEPAFRKRG